MGRVRIDSIGLARCDHFDRRLVHPGIANLHRAGVRAQQQAVAVRILTLDIKGVVHGARRMILRRVQCGEVEKILFNFRAVGDVKTDRAKDRFDPLDRHRDRVQATGLRPAPWQSDIDRLLRQARVELCLLQRCFACPQRLFDRLFDFIKLLAALGPLRTGELTQRFHRRSDRTVFAKIARFAVG